MTSSPTARGRSAAACRGSSAPRTSDRGSTRRGRPPTRSRTSTARAAGSPRSTATTTSTAPSPRPPTAPLLNASAATPAPGSLLFTIGCHAGLSSIDAYGVAGDPGLGDWSAQLTKGGSLFVGNTGFGYGDSGTVAYSERLLANFASQLATRASTAGQALMFAKQQYFSALGVAGVYDAKALQEATFYGLPMYRVSATGGLGAPALPPPDPSGATGVSAAGFDVQPVHTAVTTDRGRYWTADGRDPIATHFRPIQPRTDLDVTPTDGAVVHGALITALASTDVTDVNPVLSRPTVDLAANEPETGPDDVAFPATLQRVQDYAAANGRHVRLNLAAGQFLSDPSDPEERGVQRLFTRIAGNVLRSRSTDFAPPRIDHVETVKAGGKVTFDVTTPDTDVTSGLALYQDAAGVWRSAGLTVAGGHARGSGPLPGDAQAAGVAFVQLVDAAGNVGLATDKGEGFALSPASDPGANAPPLLADPLPAADGTTPGPVTVRITGAARATAKVSVDGAGFVAYEAPIVLHDGRRARHRGASARRVDVAPDDRHPRAQHATRRQRRCLRGDRRRDADRPRAGCAGQRHRRRQRRAHGAAGRHDDEGHADPQRQRLVHATPRGRTRPAPTRSPTAPLTAWPRRTSRPSRSRSPRAVTACARRVSARRATTR